MEVVLLEDVKALQKGQIVVNEGYACNFILPKSRGVGGNSKEFK